MDIRNAGSMDYQASKVMNKWLSMWNDTNSRGDPHQTDYQYRLTEETIMKNSFRQEVVGLFGIALVLCLSIPAWSIELRESKGAPQVRNAKRMNDAMRHSEEAAKVFDEIMAVPDKAISRNC